MQVSPMMRFWGPAMPRLLCTRLPTNCTAARGLFFWVNFRGTARGTFVFRLLLDKTLRKQCLRAWRRWGLPKVARQDLTNRCVVGVVAVEPFIRRFVARFPLSGPCPLWASPKISSPHPARGAPCAAAAGRQRRSLVCLRFVFYRVIIAATCSLAPLRALATPAVPQRISPHDGASTTEMSHHDKIKERTNTFAFRSAAEDGAAADKGVKNKHVSAARRCPAATRSSARTARSCEQNLRLPRRLR